MKQAEVKIALYDQGNGESSWLQDLLGREGCTVIPSTLAELSSVCAQGSIDLIVMNLSQNPSEELHSTLREIKQTDEEIPILCLTAQCEVKEVVRLMKAGIYDLVQLPMDQELFLHAVNKAVTLYRLSKKVFYLERQQAWKGEFLGIVGSSPQMKENFKVISTVAKSTATVLVLGESGTGKELVAKAIHMLSDRAKNKFIDLNCGAIPKELLENELFGHERGAYTGADRRYIGSFQRAHGGTLFLDEICEMDMSLQVKLLRVLQERNLTRVGGSEKIEVDVRIVAATNRNILEEVEKGRFREDLYYRLNVINVVMPPLRERPEDIPLLVRHFLEIHSSKNNKIFYDIQPEALNALMNYSWPGNVRELENVLERVVVLYNDSQLKLKHLPEAFQSMGLVKKQVLTLPPSSTSSSKLSSLKELEQMAIEEALKIYGGNIPQVAKALQMGQATLYRKLQKYQIKRL